MQTVVCFMTLPRSGHAYSWVVTRCTWHDATYYCTAPACDAYQLRMTSSVETYWTDLFDCSKVSWTQYTYTTLFCMILNPKFFGVERWSYQIKIVDRKKEMKIFFGTETCFLLKQSVQLLITTANLSVAGPNYHTKTLIVLTRSWW